MNKTEPQQFAFPVSIDLPQFKAFGTGLTKREHFAAMAMQGILSNPEIKKDIQKGRESIKDVMETVALNSIDAADALINELNKQPNEKT